MSQLTTTKMERRAAPVILRPTLCAETTASLLAVSRLWKVRLRFRKGCLMQSGDEALFVGAADSSPGPYHLLLSPADWGRLADWDAGSLVSAQGGRLERGGLVVDPAASAVYGVSPAALDAAGAAWAERRLSRFLLAENPETGFGGRAAAIFNKGGSFPFSPADLAESRRRLEMLAWLIGRGPGLTPSGDDFIIGLMALSPPWLELPEQMAALLGRRQNLTGLVSLAYYRAALARRFDHNLCLATRAAARRDEKTFDQALARLLAHGRTSGADLLCGALFTLKMKGYGHD
ncbi:MAG: DUF2877 domain-containing protein [Candidatus Adiutrix sp.]|jgi:hypothetical protein|nr:DUF2877 domain-containing protein [Candidatus Adiutrix sp.]